MSKTNHRRGKTKRKDPRASEIQYAKHYGNKLVLSDRVVGATATAGDSTCGKHGIAQKRRGAKKFVNSRTRFHENQATRKLLEVRDLGLE